MLIHFKYSFNKHFLYHVENNCNSQYTGTKTITYGFRYFYA